MDLPVRVFAYGSNMCLPRVRARIPSATPFATGYVPHYRLAFHKRGRDGSAKANVIASDRASDRVWGVVLSLTRADKRLLDHFETGYEHHEIAIVNGNKTCHAVIYIAATDFVDESLKPFSWYMRFVIQGALQHQLPADYVRFLCEIEAVEDPDPQRNFSNAKILKIR